jgi:hypothetical protein
MEFKAHYFETKKDWSVCNYWSCDDLRYLLKTYAHSKPLVSVAEFEGTFKAKAALKMR